MILKSYNDFINESNEDKNDFIFEFSSNCGQCEGTGTDQHGECGKCRGAGFNKVWDYDEDLGVEMDYDEDCDKCDGTGEISTECENCEDGSLNWNLEFRKGEGVHNMYEDTGNADQPIQYDDGRVAYNHPSLFPSEIKDIVKHIFDHKDLEIKELVNSVVRYMIKEGYDKEFKIGEDMEELLDSETKRLISSTKGIRKYNL